MRVLYNGITSPFQGEVRGSTPLTRSTENITEHTFLRVCSVMFSGRSVMGRRTAEQEFLAENSCKPVPRPNASDGEHLSRGRLPLPAPYLLICSIE